MPIAFDDAALRSPEWVNRLGGQPLWDVSPSSGDRYRGAATGLQWWLAACGGGDTTNFYFVMWCNLVDWRTGSLRLCAYSQNILRRI